MKRKILMLSIIGLLLSNPLIAIDRYVNPVSGSDLNSGTFTSPYKTLIKGLASLRIGDKLYLRAGNYVINSPLIASTAIMTILPYQNEVVTIQPANSTPIPFKLAVDILPSGKYIDSLLLPPASPKLPTIELRVNNVLVKTQVGSTTLTYTVNIPRNAGILANADQVTVKVIQ